MSIKVALLGAGVLAGISLLVPTANAATKYVKVGQTNHNFLATKRTLTTTDEEHNHHFTIPKGTIVDVDQVTWSGDKKGQTYVEINLQRLSYRIRGQYLDSSSARIAATTKNFKRVHVPQYVQYYATQKTYAKNVSRSRMADGNLYAGTKIPDIYNKTRPTAARVYVTSDGYIEYYKSAPVLSLVVKQTPSVSAKITKVKRIPSSGLTQLYTKKAVPTAIAKRVSQSGSQQYLTSIKRRYRSTATVFYQSNIKTSVDSVRLASLYKVTGHNYYMNTDVVFTEP